LAIDAESSYSLFVKRLPGLARVRKDRANIDAEEILFLITVQIGRMVLQSFLDGC
jgi:hypothetical protein